MVAGLVPSRRWTSGAVLRSLYQKPTASTAPLPQQGSTSRLPWPANIPRAPTENSEPFASSTTPAPSDPRTRGAFARGYPPDRMVCSSGVTPAAVIFTSTPSVRNVRLGNVRQLLIPVISESFRSHCAHDLQFLLIQT